MTDLLIIDDSPDDVDWLTDMAEQAGGFEVRSYRSGRAGLAGFREHGADCVLLDHRLGGEDGLDVLAELKDQSPLTPVLLLTGQGNEDVAAQSIRSGAANYLVKRRLTKVHLSAAIDNALQRAALEAKVADQEMQRRQFLNILVKELRAPLENILELGELAVDAADGPHADEVRDLLDSQRAVTVRATDLIAMLERYALLDVDVDFEPVSLTEVAEAAKDNLATVIKTRRAEVTVFDMPVIQGNAPQLTQLFQNLIENGLKHNKARRPQVFVGPDADGETAPGAGFAVTVNDNGIGMAKGDCKTVFDPLQRLDRADEVHGLGLGLTICKKIVERHGGRISCRSTAGEGSAFTLRFPA